MRKIKFPLAVKLSLTFAGLFALVMFLVVYVVKDSVESQFKAHYERDIAAALTVTDSVLSGGQAAIAAQLQKLANKIGADREFELHAMVTKETAHPYIVNYAEEYMSVMGLDALLIADRKGTALSLGHRRLDYGRPVGEYIKRLENRRYKKLIAWFELSKGKFVPCFTALKRVTIKNNRFYLLGGKRITPHFLETLRSDSTTTVMLQFSDSLLIKSSVALLGSLRNQVWLADSVSFQLPKSLMQVRDGYAMGAIPMQDVRESKTALAWVAFLRPTTELEALLTQLNQSIFYVAVFGILLMIFLAIWRARAVAKPLSKLAFAAENLSLARLDTVFEAGKNDETGILASALNRMVRGLRKSRMELANAEQKAALGELARQVNHDVKNGFMPIRSVMGHWEEVAQETPQSLISVFQERKSTVLESVDYLESLTKNYIRLQPRLNPVVLDVHGLIEELVENYAWLPDADIEFKLALNAENAVVEADRIQLRRAFENILKNSIEAIEKSGCITISSKNSNEELLLDWQDTGSGIPADVQEKLFTTHFTTKDGGTGIGLSNVKRIIEDIFGRVSIKSNLGEGTCIKIVLPVVYTKNKNPD